MKRLDARYNVELPVTLTVTDPVERWQVQTRTSNIGLGGAFFATDFSPPAGIPVQTETAIPGHGHVLLPGKVVRHDIAGFAVKFENLNVESRFLLQKYIHEEVLAKEHCPVCHNYLGEERQQCPFCNHPITLTDEAAAITLECEKAFDPLEKFEVAMDRFHEGMSEIADRYPDSCLGTDIHVRMAQEVIKEFTLECQYLEKVIPDRELIKYTQRRFRAKTDALISKSHFMNHARTWPQGYVGDHKIIEDIYRNMPLSEGMGLVLDLVFLATALGKAVPARKDKMRDILEEEISLNSSSKILNIGCGSCRELAELGTLIKGSKARITCLDFDVAALDYASERLIMFGIADHCTFRKYDALKMISQKRNAREFGPQNLIYSIGLLDYLTDEFLIRFIRAIYDLLEPGGKFIAVFKDADFYGPHEYHWVVDWDAFYQRKALESKRLILGAGIPEENISVERDRTGVILFYTLERKE